MGDVRVTHSQTVDSLSEIMMNDRLDPLTLVITAAIIGALAGVAALLRSTKALTWRVVLSAALNSGALGAGMAMLLFTYFKDNTWFLLGLCLLAGLGGMTLLGFIIAVCKKGGLVVDIKLPQTHEEEENKNDPKS